MPFGLPWTETFIQQLDEKDVRDEYVADQVRSRIAMLIRALREQRGWSQKKLGDQAGKPQNVVSRLEDPDYGKESLQTLLELAAAFDLPLLVDIPEWEEWLDRVGRLSKPELVRSSFNSAVFCSQARENLAGITNGKVVPIGSASAITMAGSEFDEEVEDTELKLDHAKLKRAYAAS